MMLIAAGIQLPWPIVWLAGLTTLLVALSSAITLVRASSIKANIELIRNERDDYAKAYEHADHDRKELQEKLQAEMTGCKQATDRLTNDIEALRQVVSGSSAVKELGVLLVELNNNNHRETIAAIRAANSETKSLMEAILALLGQGGRVTGHRKTDTPRGSTE